MPKRLPARLARVAPALLFASCAPLLFSFFQLRLFSFSRPLVSSFSQLRLSGGLARRLVSQWLLGEKPLVPIISSLLLDRDLLRRR